MKSRIVEENIYNQAILAISKKEIVIDIGGFSPLKGFDLKKCNLSSYKEEFRNTNYYCLDILIDGKPHIVGDAHDLPIKSESIDGIICIAVLEHILDPQKAVNEMFRILKKDGLAFLYLPFLYPYHADSYMKDYHRFSIDLILYMFKDFTEITIQPGENFAKTSIRFLTAFSYRNYLGFLEKPIEYIFNHISRFNLINNTTGFNILARK
jgi:SAM-dependent methyltransferase